MTYVIISQYDLNKFHSVFLAAIAADVNSILNKSFGLRWLLSVSTEESKLKEERPLCLTQQCKYLGEQEIFLRFLIILYRFSYEMIYKCYIVEIF